MLNVAGQYQMEKRFAKNARSGMSKNVAILGCGPAGLMVAHAAQLSGWDFHIFSKKQKSKLFGAQYLHQAIPGLEHGGPVTVKYNLQGTPEMYRRKVYGGTWDGTVSPEDYLEEHSAWDLRAAYEHMWFEYGGEVIDCELQGHFNFITAGPFDIVISTVPRTVWDSDESHFESTKVWAIGDGDYERVHLYRPDPFHIVCDGTKDHKWYRVSNIFGHCTMEWPQWWNGPYATVEPPARGASLISKPLRYTGNSAPDFRHLGRFGAWEKGVLTSDVFFQAMRALADDKIS